MLCCSLRLWVGEYLVARMGVGMKPVMPRKRKALESAIPLREMAPDHLTATARPDFLLFFKK